MSQREFLKNPKMCLKYGVRWRIDLNPRKAQTKFLLFSKREQKARVQNDARDYWVFVSFSWCVSLNSSRLQNWVLSRRKGVKTNWKEIENQKSLAPSWEQGSDEQLCKIWALSMSAILMSLQKEWDTEHCARNSQFSVQLCAENQCKRANLMAILTNSLQMEFVTQILPVDPFEMEHNEKIKKSYPTRKKRKEKLWPYIQQNENTEEFVDPSIQEHWMFFSWRFFRSIARWERTFR